MRNTMPQMIAERFLLDFIEGRTHGTNLRDHVDAVAIFLDHASNTAHLAFNAAEPRELGFLELLVHGLKHTPVGYKWQAMKHDCCQHDHHHSHGAENTATDPVCGMKVKIATAK